MNKYNLIIGVIASIALILSVVGLNSGGVNLSGTTTDDWNVGGNLAVTGTTALTATSTLSDSLLMTKTGGIIAIGTSTPATTFDVTNANTTSSAYFYSGASGYGGRLIMENSVGGTCYQLYFDANGSFATTSIACGTLQR